MTLKEILGEGPHVPKGKSSPAVVSWPAMLEALFREGVVAVAATPAMWEAPLLPEEAACLADAAPPLRPVGKRGFPADRRACCPRIRRYALCHRRIGNHRHTALSLPAGI